MVAVIIGGSGSGKSEFAENMAVELYATSCDTPSSVRNSEDQNCRDNKIKIYRNNEIEKYSNNEIDKYSNIEIDTYSNNEIEIHNDKEVENFNNIADIYKKKKLIYIATMEPYGEEGKQRIKRHHQLRAGKGFQTIECYTGLADVVILSESTVLLECMSNLAANEYFSETGAGEKAEEAIANGLESLAQQSDNLIIVTNNVFDDGFQYDKETLEYMMLLGKVNQWISSRADQVIEVVHGIPIYLK